MGRMAEIKCAQCASAVLKPVREINRAHKKGFKLFCGRGCSSLSRRSGLSPAEKKEAKRLYDARYRDENLAEIKVKKHRHYKKTYDRAKAAEYRKARMPYHVQYCRDPGYRAWKKSYDRQHRAKKFYGPLWECFLLTLDIRQECLAQQSDYEIRLSKGTLNKSQQRKREYERSFRQEPEIGPLGNAQFGQGRQNGSLTGR